MQIITHRELIEAHWGDCDVQQGETPEDYAIRHEEPVMTHHRAWVLTNDGWLTWSETEDDLTIFGD